MKRFMQSFIYIVVVLAVIAIAVGNTAYAAQKEKARGPVILMLDPEGTLLRGGNSDHKSSLVIVADPNGRHLGIAEIPGLVSENVVTRRNSNGVDEVISTNEGDFKDYKDSAVADIWKYSKGPAVSSVNELSRTPMYIVFETCGKAYCRIVKGQVVDCFCGGDVCYDCQYTNIFE